MSSRFVRPDVAILHISRGDTLTVRRRLTAGEQRRAYTRMSHATGEGKVAIDPMQTGIGLIVAYLIDWSFSDESGPVPIRGLSVEDLAERIDALDYESFIEIKEAIEAHETAMRAERQAEKNAQDGETRSSATSPLQYGAAGVSSGSPT